MHIAILVNVCLILVIAVLIWLHGEVVIHPNNEWSVISEQNSSALWNESN
jgi:hypothetical protein